MTLKKEVSLLPDSENPNSFNAKIVKWLTTVGRAAVMLTELIIVTAFISRFWLDRKNADLSETIRQQQAILSTTTDFEKEFNGLQQKLETIHNFYINETQYSQRLNNLTQSVPPDIVFNSIALGKDPNNNQLSATVSLTAYKEESIIDFIANLTLSPDINSVNIQNIEKKIKDNNYQINLSLTFKPNQTKS